LNLTSGPAPLTVQFSDESSGLPTGWQWDFGDSEQSYEENPVHIFTQPGVYDISLTVSNIFGNASVTKSELVTIMDGTYFVITLPSEGIQIQNTDQLILNTTLVGNFSFDSEEGSSIILFEQDEASGIAQIRFMAENGTKFISVGNDTLTGNISRIVIRSYDLVPLNFSQETGNQCFFNFTLNINQYEPGGMVHSVAWAGSTPDDFNQFDLIALENNSILDYIAYSVQFKEDLQSENQVALIFGVSSDWVDQYGWRWCHHIEADPPGASVFVDSRYIGDAPICIEEGLSPGNHTVTVKEVGYYPKTFPITIDDKRDSIHVIRIGDDGTGEVLNTTFIGHDPERNLDFFRAESPNGLSTFGLASLSKSGNIPQLVNLIISEAAHAAGGGGGGGGGSSASASLGSALETTAPTPVAPEPAETLSPLPEERPAPEITSQSMDTAAPEEPTPLETSEAQEMSPLGSLVEGTSSLIILRNLSVIFVVIFVSLVFYLRWKK
jgi:PKD repeat protein